VQELSFGLIEAMRLEDGRVSSLSLGEYKLSAIKDISPPTAADGLGPGYHWSNTICRQVHWGEQYYPGRCQCQYRL
jgi:hypothetical protein